jgi:hypothetical protein
VYRWQNAWISNLGSYRACLNIRICEHGVCLVPVLWMRFWHVPLFFPWESVNPVNRKIGLLTFNYVAKGGNNELFFTLPVAALARYRYG